MTHVGERGVGVGGLSDSVILVSSGTAGAFTGKSLVIFSPGVLRPDDELTHFILYTSDSEA